MSNPNSVDHPLVPATGRGPRRPGAITRIIPAALAASVAAAIAAGGVAVASANTATNRGSETIKVVTHDQGSNFVDNPPSGDSVGDVGIFDQTISQDGRPYGHGALYFVETRKGATQSEDSFEATGSFILPRGEISAQGQIRAGARRVTIPITGGTGAYRDVRGYVASINNQNGSTTTLHLIGVEPQG